MESRMVGGLAHGVVDHGVVDAAVVDAARAGDRSAWNDLVGRYAGLVHAVCRCHGLGGADAAAVNQVVWLRTAEHLGRFRPPEAVGPWIAAVARGECLRALRAAGRIPPVPGAAPGPALPDRGVVEGPAVPGRGVVDPEGPAVPDPAVAEPAVAQPVVAEPGPGGGGGAGSPGPPGPPPSPGALLAALSRLDPASQRLLRLAAARPRPGAAELGAALDLPDDAVGPALDRALARLAALAGPAGAAGAADPRGAGG